MGVAEGSGLGADGLLNELEKPGGEKMEKRTERRRDQRLELMLPLEYSLPSAPASFPRTGQTQNVSTGGVYFVTDRDPEVTAPVRIGLRIAVPWRQDTGGPPLTLCGEGDVVRVEKLASPAGQAGGLPRWGVAVSFTSKPTVRMSSLIEYLMGEQ